ncbi:endonuclease/exonuclease/phosphatase family protein [Mobilibacterium timonense]|uniref:endonuclease/exonuclease/phosphatase family protein n=1 Tax=Mobilibacterium timonense TaxID=1871012 RepID=UPI002356E993|nr:endonuclease/exonuclease/phosphatase family protein [Mobilibacterium timonense]MBM6991107.1 endonuclease/exonuclease/phosphatase family protein [Mobilibacterium timonense]
MAGTTKPLKTWQKVLRVILIIIICIALVFVAFLGFLTVTEYKPADREPLNVSGSSSQEISEGDQITAMTWNIGYGALGDNADFFMDGGSSVKTADKDRLNENMKGITDEIQAVDPDVGFFQEVDQDSTRSHHVDESKMLSNSLSGYNSTFATNFKVAWIPYPLPMIGKVSSGIQTFSRYQIADATRIQLPCPFSWPVRLGNLKRCLAVNRVKLENSDKELVLVNLHLEAYDNGEGKKKQTAMLRNILQQETEKGNYVIAAGDFNQIFSNVENPYPVLDGMWKAGAIDTSDFNDSLQFCMDNSTPSCRSLDRALDTAKSTSPDKFQYYIIDGFIVSSNITVDSLQTQDLGFKNSDHNPVVIKLTLNEQ